MVAASAPHLKREDHRSLLLQLEAIARPLDPPRAPPAPMERIADDPEAARRWFEERGIHVITPTA